MKTSSFVWLAFLSAACLVMAEDTPKKDAPVEKPTADSAPQRKLETEEEKAGYAIGYRLGERTRTQFSTNQFGKKRIDVAALLAGLEDAMNGKRPSLSGRESDAAVMAARKKVQQDRDLYYKDAVENNKARGVAFMKANKEKKGVLSLASGAQYLVLKEGTGKTPKATDDVEVHYHGTLIDGTVFDSSVDRGEPIRFTVNGGVIQGWTEVLQLMKEGSKWRVFLPPYLAYGQNGREPTIGPFAVLIFEIELIKVK